MNGYITFKRTALLMLMFIAAWCLPVQGQNKNSLADLDLQDVSAITGRILWLVYDTEGWGYGVSDNGIPTLSTRFSGTIKGTTEKNVIIQVEDKLSSILTYSGEVIIQPEIGYALTLNANSICRLVNADQYSKLDVISGISNNVWTGGIGILNNGNLTIDGGAIDVIAKPGFRSISSATGIVNNNGSLLIMNGAVVNTKAEPQQGGVTPSMSIGVDNRGSSMIVRNATLKSIASNGTMNSQGICSAGSGSSFPASFIIEGNSYVEGIGAGIVGDGIYSHGIYNGLFSTLRISGGRVLGIGGDNVSNSYGISNNDNLIIEGGDIKGVGGKATLCSSGLGFGVKTIISGNAKIQAFGGESDNRSIGIFCDGMGSTTTITGGTILSVGGKGKELSCGIYNGEEKFSMSNGQLFAYGQTKAIVIADNHPKPSFDGSFIQWTLPQNELLGSTSYSVYSMDDNTPVVTFQGNEDTRTTNVTSFGTFLSPAMYLLKKEQVVQKGSFDIEGSSDIVYENRDDTSKFVATKNSLTSYINISDYRRSPFSEEDISGLLKIAKDNNNTVLEEYVNNQGWLTGTNQDPIFMEWSENTEPARLRSLNLTNQKDRITILDVSPFSALVNLELSNSQIHKLDISMLSKLEYLNIWNTSLSYNDVILPKNIDNLYIFGTSVLQDWKQGEPVPGLEGNYQMPAGSEVDLSAYVTLNGQKSIFQWYKYGNNFPEGPVLLDSIAPGRYKMPVQTEGNNTWYYCRINTSKFPEWGVRTPSIRLTRGAIDYSQNDINLLKALATANPNCSELKEFIKAEGWKESWKESYWQDENRKVAVDWDFSTPARISKLRVRNADTIASFNISTFTELTYLDCNELKLKTLDLSKNTKLEQIELSFNNLASLDVSKCSNLVYLNCSYQRDNNYNVSLKSLDIVGCTKLQSLYIHGNSELNVDLSGAKELRVLQISSTTKLARYASNPPATVTELYSNDTDYPALDLAKHPQITSYGVPRQVTELDVTKTNLYSLDLNGSGVLYSTLKKKPDTKVNGESLMKAPGSDNPKEWREIENGDTIDFSSEASVNGVATIYLWVDTRSWTVIENAFIPVPNKPGIFVANAPLNKDYVCFIHNPEYCSEFTLNRRSGWVIRSYYIHVKTPPAAYDETEVAALKAIVDASTSKSLKEWWDSKAWQSGYYPKDWRFQANWYLDLEENKLHMSDLQLINLRDTLTELKVSAFKELINLNCSGNKLTTLSVKNNSKLRYLDCSWNNELASIVLPDNKVSLKNLTCNGSSKLASLDVTGYSNLEMLSVRQNTLLTTLDVSQNAGLLYLWCNNTPINNPNISNCKKLREYGVPSTITAFDMNTCDSLKVLDPSGSKLKFSTVTLKQGQPWEAEGYFTDFSIDGVRKAFGNYHLLSNSDWVDISSEMMINGKASTVKKSEYVQPSSNLTVEVKDGKVRFNGQPRENFSVVVENPVFKGWKIELYGEIYTCDGDANLDSKVNVQDIVATVNYILKDTVNMLPYEQFGYYESDVNQDNKWEIADIVGIANIILGKQVTKSSALRSNFIPTVELTAEDGFLCMNTPVAIAGIQLEFTGLKEIEGLLGQAATFTQASYLGDTTRILGYSMKGETIPVGKSILMKLPAGVRLVKAAFSDENAQSLAVSTRGDISTSNEAIGTAEGMPQISNYPNPFRSSTTLVYRLDDNTDNAYIQVFAANGRLVQTLNGLSVQAGENRYAYTTTLAAGTYFYRLVTQKQGVTTYSKSNTFIIK